MYLNKRRKKKKNEEKWKTEPTCIRSRERERICGAMCIGSENVIHICMCKAQRIHNSTNRINTHAHDTYEMTLLAQHTHHPVFSSYSSVWFILCVFFISSLLFFHHLLLSILYSAHTHTHFATLFSHSLPFATVTIVIVVVAVRPQFIRLVYTYPNTIQINIWWAISEWLHFIRIVITMFFVLFVCVFVYMCMLLARCRYCYFYLDCNYFITPLRRKTCRTDQIYV